MLLDSLFNKSFYKNTISENSRKTYILLSYNLSYLDFSDIHLEFTNDDNVKITLLFDDSKILIVSKDSNVDSREIMYTFFIDGKLIDSAIDEISNFTDKFIKFRLNTIGN